MKKAQDPAVFSFNPNKPGHRGMNLPATFSQKACDPLRFHDTGSEKLLIIYANIRV